MKTLAIFDLDETLIGVDSSSAWLQWLVDNGLADQQMLATEQQMMLAYHRGELSMQDYMDFTLKPLAGKTTAELHQWVDKFVVEKILHLRFPLGFAQLDWHRSQGHRVLIISATADFIVRLIASSFGVMEVIAIDLAEHAGVLSGSSKGVLSFREGKVIRLTAWLQENGASFDGSYGYSDSANDVPLLQAVTYAHVVNPAPALKALAERHHWPIFNWSLPAASAVKAAVQN